MKNTLLAVLAFVLAASLPAQCFGNYPAGTQSTAPWTRCAPSGSVGPWVTPASPVVSTIGLTRIYFSDLPAGQALQWPLAFVTLDAVMQLVPITLPGGCLALVLPGLALVPCTVDGFFHGCQTGGLIQFPPDPALAGLQLFGQGFVEESPGAFATSEVFRITVQ